MRNKKKLWAILHFLMITVGTFVYSVALEMFLVPNLVLDGGLTGISLMINYQTGILLGLLTFLLNIPFVVLGWRMLGLRFAGSYLYAMILLSGFTALLHDVAPVTDNELLSVVFGGILLGIGVGLVIKGGACLDGTELLAMLCSKRLPVSVGQGDPVSESGDLFRGGMSVWHRSGVAFAADIHHCLQADRHGGNRLQRSEADHYYLQ